MRPALIVVALLAGCAPDPLPSGVRSAPTASSEPRFTFHVPGSAFEITFPGAPEVTSETIDGNTVHTAFYDDVSNRGRSYTVQWIDWPEPLTQQQAEAVRDNLIARLSDARFTAIKLDPPRIGFEIEGYRPKTGKQRGRIYFIGTRYYNLVSIGHAPSDTTRFLDSFRESASP